MNHGAAACVRFHFVTGHEFLPMHQRAVATHPAEQLKTDRQVLARANVLLWWYFRILLDVSSYVKLPAHSAAHVRELLPSPRGRGRGGDEQEFVMGGLVESRPAGAVVGAARGERTHDPTREVRLYPSGTGEDSGSEHELYLSDSGDSDLEDFSSPQRDSGQPLPAQYKLSCDQKKTKRLEKSRIADRRAGERTRSERTQEQIKKADGMRRATRFQDKMRWLGGMDFLFNLLRTYVIAFVHYEATLLWLLLRATGTVLERSSPNCSKFVRNFDGLDLLINIFSLFLEQCQVRSEIHGMEAAMGVAADDAGAGATSMAGGTTTKKPKFDDWHAYLMDVVQNQPDTVRFLECNFLNMALVCGQLTKECQGLFCQDMVGGGHRRLDWAGQSAAPFRCRGRNVF